MKKFSREIEKLKKSIISDYDIRDETGLSLLQQGLEALETVHKAQAIIDEQGLTVNGDRGGIKAHPLLATIRDARAQFLACIKALNLDLEPLRDAPGRPAGR